MGPICLSSSLRVAGNSQLCSADEYCSTHTNISLTLGPRAIYDCDSRYLFQQMSVLIQPYKLQRYTLLQESFTVELLPGSPVSS